MTAPKSGISPRIKEDCRPDLGGQDLQTQDPGVQVLGLQHERAALLIEQRPEHTGDREYGEETSQAREPLGPQLPDEFSARRGQVDEPMTAHPEDDRRGEHQGPGHGEGHPGAVMFQQPRRRQDRDQAAAVYREVKPRDGAAQAVSVPLAELVRDARRDQGLDPPGARRDQSEPDQQAPSCLVQHEGQVAQAVDKGEPQDHAVFPEDPIGKYRSDDWCEVDGRREQMVRGLRLCLAHRGRAAGRAHEMVGHEDDQAGLEAVKREPFCALVADDVGDARGHPIGFLRRRPVWGATGLGGPMFTRPPSGGGCMICVTPRSFMAAVPVGACKGVPTRTGPPGSGD